jgi:hypothetical protein
MRIASFILLALGLCTAAICFFGLSAESLPYQDPTAAMLAAQQSNIRWWQAGFFASLATSGLAAIFIWRNRRPAVQPHESSEPTSSARLD